MDQAFDVATTPPESHLQGIESQIGRREPETCQPRIMRE
jgi:hypothetical protein